MIVGQAGNISEIKTLVNYRLLLLHVLLQALQIVSSASRSLKKSETSFKETREI